MNNEPTTHTGVVVALADDFNHDDAVEMRHQLEQRFPGVTFATIPGAIGSVAFHWTDEGLARES